MEYMIEQGGREYFHLYEGYYSTKQRRWELYRVCEHCGTLFKAKRSNARYCSPACRMAAWREKNNPAPLYKMPVKHGCPVCGREFRIGNRKAVYCSNACRQKAYRQSKKDNGDSNV